MNRSRILVTLLTVALVISAAANVYFGSTIGPRSSDSVKVEMNAVLSDVQAKVDSEIQRIATSVVYASQQLTETGISGDEARAVISALAANSSYIIEAATQNLDRKMMIVEPAAFHVNEGKIIGEQKWLNPNPIGDITPMMTPLIMLIVNNSGCSIVAPIFNADKELIGTVSSIFSPQRLLTDSIAAVPKASNYNFSATQLDGIVVYSASAEFRNKNLFTDPSLSGYTGIIAVAHQTVQQSSGYATYTVGSQQRECYWTTISAYGQQWRLVIHHAL